MTAERKSGHIRAPDFHQRNKCEKILQCHAVGFSGILVRLVRGMTGCKVACCGSEPVMIIRAAEENLLASASSSCDVVSDAFNGDTSNSRHKWIVLSNLPILN
jgi:hypothetical protein